MEEKSNNQFNKGEMTPEDRAAWSEKKREQRDAVYALVDKQTETVFSNPKDLSDHLKRQAIFGKMGVTNVLLVGAQSPNATEIRNYDEWKERGRTVNRGEKAIAILAPNGEYTREDGTTRQNYEVKSVFDVSQTSGKFLNQRRAYSLPKVIKALTTKFPIELVPSNDVKDAVFDPDHFQVELNRNLSADAKLYAIAREYAISNDASVFEAQCAASIVCYRYGARPEPISEIDPDMKYADRREMKSALNRIKDNACAVCDHIDHNLQLERQRNQDAR